ncbi:hypothetical protein NEOLEDRAFT_1183784 [Neolentinus lepideus HHB14362 ss-1]|uniref:Uncharacterized protein n=1 Tax=Neolentinus lepideus HHB14362 ss-1 TaxID=1314782 RepID=A0A165MZB5_9AGAM|nr:hypothetical protein NEOLEDRAFT_1183784 [Neolentinus lepideus HHB14362 ss-1]
MLNDGDMWNLSPMMQSQLIFIKFNTLQGSLVCVICNYLSPFFLKRILDVIQDGSKESIRQAYVHALLVFLFQVAKVEADVQHLWFGPKAEEVREAKGKSKDDKKKDRDKANEDEPEPGVDTGKIMNLMANDTGSVSSLKRSARASSVDMGEGFGIVDGVFKWSKIEQPEKTKDKGKERTKDMIVNGNGPAAEEAPTPDSVSEASDCQFELKHINIMFPEGELSLVTRPTASGKTALPMSYTDVRLTMTG